MAEEVLRLPDPLLEPFTPTAGLIPATEAATAEALRSGQEREARRVVTGIQEGPEERLNRLEMESLQRYGGKEPDVEIDITSGLPRWQRVQMAFKRAQSDQERYLEEKYPGKVRLSPQGRWIVRTVGEGGKPKDITVDPNKMEIGDVFELAGQFPEMIGELAALLGRKPGPGLLSAGRTLVTSALGGQVAGGIVDVSQRLEPGVDIDFEEIARARGELALGSALVGGLFGVGGKILSKVISPFANPGAKQLDFRKAQAFFEKATGEKIPGTPAELTGSTALTRLQSVLEKRPGGAPPFKGLKGEQEKSYHRLQNIALGLNRDADEAARNALLADPEVAGRQALSGLRAEVGDIEAPVDIARRSVRDVGTEEITRALGVNPAGKVNIPFLGRWYRDAAVGQRDLFNSYSDDFYNRFYDHPLALVKNVNVDTIASRMRKVHKELPSKTKRTEVPTGVLDPQGNPIMATKEGAVVLKDYVPPGVLSRLETLIGLKGEKMAINELKQMRTDVSSAIAEGEAVPGVKTGYLKLIEKELTGAIDDGLKQINDPSLTAAWRTATDYYRANVDKFREFPIARLFKTNRQSGGIGDVEVIETIRRGGDDARDTYDSYKRFFGATSPEIKGLQKAIKDDVLGRSYNEVGEYIDGKAFLGRMRKIIDDSPEIARDLWDEQTRGELRDTAARMGAAAGKIPVEEIEKAMANPNRTAFWFDELLTAERERARRYTNDILAKTAKGEVAPDLVPEDFVNRFLPNAKRSDIVETMNILRRQDPDLAEHIQQTAVFNILNEATPAGGRFTTPFKARGAQLEPKAVNLDKILSDPQRRPKLEALLGDDQIAYLDNYVKLMAPTEQAEDVGKSVGGLSAGFQFANLISGGILKFMGTGAANWFESAIMVNPLFRRWVSNTVIPPQAAATMVNTMIASAPFITRTIKQFGTEAAEEVMADMKAGVDAMEDELGRRFPATPRPQAERLVLPDPNTP